jgi:hypothetical protein
MSNNSWPYASVLDETHSGLRPQRRYAQPVKRDHARLSVVFSGRFAVITAMVAFVLSYMYGIQLYGWVLGVAIGWIPSMAFAWLVALVVGQGVPLLIQSLIASGKKLSALLRHS